MRWFRMHSEVRRDPKIQTMNGDSVKMWINFLCFASDNNGYLPAPEEMAWELRLSVAKVKSSIESLAAKGLIDISPEGHYMHNWNVRQFQSDSSTERVKKHRQKQERNVSCNAKETDSDNRVQKTDTEQIRTEHTNAPDGALFAISPIQRTRGKRTTEEIRKALGPRLSWWEKFWAAYPCHEGMNPAMDAFERLVTSEEIFRAVMGGAGRYAAKARADPNMKLKYGQGWLNDQRWTDEDSKAAVRQVAPTVVLPDRKWDLLGDMRRDAEARKAEEPDEETKAWYAKLDEEFMGKREVKSQ